MARITFLGAAQTTTGSKHLLTWQGEKREHRLMIDCGMFQGLRELRRKNWDPFPLSPETIDAIILTHGHLDHVGYLPKLVREGFDGPIYATSATLDIAELILRDSAHIQVEDARLAKKFGYSRHENPEPLYTEEDAEKVMPLFKPIDYFRSYELIKGCTVRLHHAGHILGSAFVEVTVEEGGHPIRVVFSGDVGRFNQPIIKDPEPPTGADYFILEGTYGDRVHDTADPLTEIAEVVNRTVKRDGMVVIPAFAVGRSQQLLYFFAQLLDDKRIPPVDIFLDSPMAVKVTEMSWRHKEELDLQTLLGVQEEKIFRRPEVHMLQTREESQTLNDRKKPCIIVSASGMASAGRVLHHLSRRLPDPKNTVLLVGYQGEGTRGRRLLEGEKEIKIHGQMVKVKAEIVNMSSLSAHADYTEMLPWMRRMVPPSRTFLVHGEPEGLTAWKGRIEKELNWDVTIPSLGESVELLPVAKRLTRLVRPERGVREIERVTPEEKVAAPSLAVIAGPGASLLPIALGAEKVYDEAPGAELARRIIAETSSKHIILFGDGVSIGATKAFRETLTEAGRRVWALAAAIE
ncbi:MAG: MBL fold metallo-hydrolase [bacterium]